MDKEKQERLDFLTRMAGIVQHADYELTVQQEDLGRLVQMVCLAEKEKDGRQQRAFERLCEIGTFHEA